MNNIRKLQILILIIIAGLGGYFFGVNKVAVEWKNYKPQINVVNQQPPTGAITVDFAPFWSVWQRLEAGYYDRGKLDAQKMLDGAISGMVDSLGDPYTVYLPPVQNDNFKEGLAGQFSGIGAELGTKEKNVIVVAPLSGSPAEKAGLAPGDVITKVNNETTSNLNLSQVVEKIRGPKGTEVTLSIITKADNKNKDLKIVRDVITVKSVDGKVRNVKCENNRCQVVAETQKCDNCDKVIQVKLSQFGDRTNGEWTDLINKLVNQTKNDSKIKGLILDLRNNPGGYLSDATYIASEFLNRGLVVVAQEGSVSGRREFRVERDGAFRNIQIVVLINKGSASASEIVAGALRDHGRAELVGETSFGKGTIQQAEDLGDGSGLHVTIAKWLTPKGTWVHGEGLTPDTSAALDIKDPSKDTQLEKAIEILVK